VNTTSDTRDWIASVRTTESQTEFKLGGCPRTAGRTRRGADFIAQRLSARWNMIAPGGGRARSAYDKGLSDERNP
jgi:hypothetical protein